MYLSSLLDPGYNWFYQDLVKSDQIQLMFIDEQYLETMIDFFRIICLRLNFKQAVVDSFSEFLIYSKEYLCTRPEIKQYKQLSLNDALEQD